MKIQFLKDGPVLVFAEKIWGKGLGNVELPLALCRCGQSKDKPWCDGEHNNCEFEGEAFEIEGE